MNDRAERDRAIAETVRQGGGRVSHTEAALLYDLSLHAFNEGFDAVRRIVDTAPAHLRAATMASALASFATVMKGHFPDHWAQFEAVPVTNEETTVIMLPPKGERREPPVFGPGRWA